MEMILTTGGMFNYIQFKEGDTVVGRIDTDDCKNCVKLWNFSIEEAFRGIGIGTQAIEMVKEHLKGKQLWLYVYKDNIAAIKVYERAGFKIEPKDYYTNAYQMTYKPIL